MTIEAESLEFDEGTPPWIKDMLEKYYADWIFQLNIPDDSSMTAVKKPNSSPNSPLPLPSASRRNSRTVRSLFSQVSAGEAADRNNNTDEQFKPASLAQTNPGPTSE